MVSQSSIPAISFNGFTSILRAIAYSEMYHTTTIGHTTIRWPVQSIPANTLQRRAGARRPSGDEAVSLRLQAHLQQCLKKTSAKSVHYGRNAGAWHQDVKQSGQ
jgi:hypothetical protein